MIVQSLVTGTTKYLRVARVDGEHQRLVVGQLEVAGALQLGGKEFRVASGILEHVGLRCACPVVGSVVATAMYCASRWMPSAMMTAATVPRSNGGVKGSGGTNDTSVVSSGLFTTNGPMPGIAKPPSWLNRLFGGPPTRVIARLMGC